ncbi:MAG: trigger factor [Bacteroidota bacterium]
MQITKESTQPLRAEIKIHLDPEDYKPQVLTELKKQAKQANMPGFRPGKVPISVVRKMVGMSVLMDELGKKLNAELTQYIQEEKLQILGEPLPVDDKTSDDFDVNCDTALDFTYEVGLAPEFEVNLSPKKKDIPPLYQIEVDDKAIDAEIKQYQERLSDVEEVEEAGKGDTIYGRIQEVSEDGSIEEEAFDKMVVLNPERVGEQGPFFETVIGKKIEDTFPLKLEDINPSVEKIAEVTFVEEEELRGLDGKELQFVLKKIQRTAPAKLTPDFFKRVMDINSGKMPEQAEEEGEEPEVTEAEFRESVKEQLAKQQENQGKQYFYQKISENLQDLNKVELPDEFLKKWLSISNKGKVTEEQIEEQYGDFETSLRWSLVLGKLEEAHPELGVEREDLEEEIRRLSKEYSTKEGEENAELAEQYFQYFMQNQELLEMQFGRIRQERQTDFFLNTFEPKEKKISLTKFQEMIEKEKADK